MSIKVQLLPYGVSHVFLIQSEKLIGTVLLLQKAGGSVWEKVVPEIEHKVAEVSFALLLVTKLI